MRSGLTHEHQLVESSASNPEAGTLVSRVTGKEAKVQGATGRGLFSKMLSSETHRNERSDRCAGRGGRGGFSGGRCSRSPPSGPSTVMLRPPEALLLVDVLRRCVRSERLEERECSVL